jgi:hypothetical protein
MDLKIDMEHFRSLIGFYIFVGLLFAILVTYFWLTSDQPAYFRDAGIAITGGFVGSLIYALWEKVFVKK